MIELAENSCGDWFGCLSNPAFQALHFPQSTHESLGLGEVVVDLGFADRSNVEAALNRAENYGMLAEEALLQDGVVTGRQLARAAASRHGMPFLDYDEFPVDEAVLERVDTQVARTHMAVPCARLDEDTILVAVSNPATVPAMEALGSVTGQHVICALAQENDVYFMIRQAERLQTLAA